MSGGIDFEKGCKYCGGPVRPGYYCCRECWDSFEEPRYDHEDEEDYEEDQDDE